nr:MAG TPA: hypothetical protein [Caudoviricetes sp.]
MSRVDRSNFNHDYIKIYSQRAKLHEVRHILRDDFNKDNCDSVEKATHI